MGDANARLSKYSSPRMETYTRKGLEDDQERVKIVRDKTVQTGTLKGHGTTEATLEETLADMPAGNAYEVMHALADYFNCKVTEQ